MPAAGVSPPYTLAAMDAFLRAGGDLLLPSEGSLDCLFERLIGDAQCAPLEPDQLAWAPAQAPMAGAPAAQPAYIVSPRLLSAPTLLERPPNWTLPPAPPAVVCGGPTLTPARCQRGLQTAPASSSQQEEQGAAAAAAKRTMQGQLKRYLELQRYDAAADGAAAGASPTQPAAQLPTEPPAAPAAGLGCLSSVSFGLQRRQWELLELLHSQRWPSSGPLELGCECSRRSSGSASTALSPTLRCRSPSVLGMVPLSLLPPIEPSSQVGATERSVPALCCCTAAAAGRVVNHAVRLVDHKCRTRRGGVTKN